jgi:hypothetical protein
MPSPFPGMDPYLENPDLWPNVHNSLIAAIRDSIAPRLRPRYFVALEERIYVEEMEPSVIRPDLTVVGARGGSGELASSRPRAGVVEVLLPVADRLHETYLEIRSVADGSVVSVIELLSPSNKRSGDGRREYLRKRASLLRSMTSLVEVDLLRSGERMPIAGARPVADYEILVSRAWERPRAQLVLFNLRDPIPAFPIPLAQGEDEAPLELQALLSSLYDRAGYDLRIDYGTAALPPISGEDIAWAAAVVSGWPTASPSNPRS